jgi:ubiquitin-protein ligase
MEEREACPVCSRTFPISQLPAHVEDCLSGGGASSFSAGPSHHTNADEEFARRLQAEESRGGPSSPISSSGLPDADEEFARKLQQEEEERNRPQGVKCQLCGTVASIDDLFILDECSHKFCKGCLRQHVAIQVVKTVTTLCPLPDCKAALSVRDMKELLPKNNPSSFIPSGSSQKATERLLQEFKQILKTQPEKQGYSVAPVRDNMYHWEVKFFNFENTEPIAQDLAKTKHKYILLHVTFPPTYPFNPPFIRVIRPRFAFRTGHVTIGGSICTELLTNSGWTPANTVESALVSIRANLILGGARLDLHNKNDYTEAEAREAFERMRQQHGW